MSVVGSGSLAPVESKYEWKIPNFRSYTGYKSGQHLLSPCFNTYYSEKDSTNIGSLQWQLRIYPSGHDNTCSKYVSIFLDNCNEFEVTSKFKFTMITPKDTNNSISKRYTENIFQPKGTITVVSQSGPSWGWSEFAEREQIFSDQSQFLANGTLTITCIISDTSISSEYQGLSCFSGLEKHNYFENLLETERFSDVTFNIDEKEMQLHKAILSSESAVFRAMFDHEMKEKNDNVVDIVDIDFDVMKELVRYIYSKKVKGIDKIAVNLLIAADKYGLLELKKLCEQSLCKNLNVDNAVQRLELAVKYDAKKLKSKTVDYVAKNLKDIVKKEEFLLLNMECKNELFISMAKNQ